MADFIYKECYTCGKDKDIKFFPNKKKDCKECTNKRYREYNKKNRNPVKCSFHCMKQRCFNIKDKNYYNYGGRGVTVCERWLGLDGFTNFLSDMGERPEGYSLDRIDVNGNYEPNNCRRATSHQQSINKRLNNKYIWGKEYLTIGEIIKIEGLNIDHRLVRSRMKIGWTLKKALYTKKESSLWNP